MDGKNHSHRRQDLGSTSDITNPPELPRCKYCKGQFKPLPKNVDKQVFCSESHRKMFWKYGSMSIGKVGQRIERDMRKLIERELRPIFAELIRLRARLDALENGADIGMGERAPSLKDRISALEARVEGHAA